MKHIGHLVYETSVSAHQWEEEEVGEGGLYYLEKTGAEPLGEEDGIGCEEGGGLGGPAVLGEKEGEEGHCSEP